MCVLSGSDSANSFLSLSPVALLFMAIWVSLSLSRLSFSPLTERMCVPANILSGAMRRMPLLLDTAGYLLLLLLFRCQLSNDWPLPLMTSVDVCVCVCVCLTGDELAGSIEHTHIHTECALCRLNLFSLNPNPRITSILVSSSLDRQTIISMAYTTSVCVVGSSSSSSTDFVAVDYQW